MIRPKEVTAPDLHFLNAAKGWLELGNYKEAQAEVDRIGYWSRFHPDVLMARWKIFARVKNWGRSLDVARSMIKLAPDRPSSWICLSYSLCNSNRNLEAWQQLVDASERFPKVSAIPYFLARLSCKMGNLDEATKWLNKWNGMVNETSLKETARKDPKLKPIWNQIEIAPETENTDESKSTTKPKTDKARNWEMVAFSLVDEKAGASKPHTRN